MFSDLLVSFNEGHAVHGNGKVCIWGLSTPAVGMGILHSTTRFPAIA